MSISRTLLALAAALLLSTASACAQFAQMQNVVSYTLYADGPCDAQQYIPAYMGSQATWFSSAGKTIDAAQNTSGTPMPNSDLWIVGAALNVVYTGEADPSQSMAMAGVANGVGGDYLIPKFQGSDTRSVSFPAGTGMLLRYGNVGALHVDMHIWCAAPLQSWQGTLTLFTVPAN